MDILKHNFSSEAAELLVGYARLLLRRNEDMNLTGADTEDEIITRHILDSLAIAQFLPRTGRIADIGSGAGFPGLPLAVILPEVDFTLVDAREKRVDFLNEAVKSLGLKNVHCVAGRAEEMSCLSDWRESFDAVVSRAVARMGMLCELCIPFLKVGGVFVAMKASDCAEEIAEASGALVKLGTSSASIEFYEAGGVTRAAVLCKKEENTPPEYPRRFSKIKKNPL